MKITLGRRTWMLGAVSTLLLGLVVLAVVGVLGIVGWEYSNSNAFCANTCHGVHPEEPANHLASSHARVNCVECHMGRTSTLQQMALKPTHANELWGMIAGYERPLHSSTLRPAREACESCHYPLADHRDSLALIKRYNSDPASTEVQIRLTLHTAYDIPREATSKGIHWHIANDVEFVTADHQRREIPWVRVTKPDGSKVTYFDSQSKLTKPELDKLEPRRMECFDCHNAVGHPFRNPVDVVDQAIAEGKIDRTLPSAKARAVGLVDAIGPLQGTMQERAAAIDRLLADASAKSGVKPEDREKEQKFNAVMKDILLGTSVSAPGLTWKSFPNHTGHKDFPGCFRCHDGKHFNDKGEAIRLQCTLCHDLPQVKVEGGKGSVASTVAPGLTPPASHNEPNFMHDHRTKVDQSCAMCHGKLEFGREGGNFCSNPACHGRTWPEVNLNVMPATVPPPPAVKPAPGAKRKA